MAKTPRLPPETPAAAPHEIPRQGGSWIRMGDGSLIPNLSDEAMAARETPAAATSAEEPLP